MGNNFSLRNCTVTENAINDKELYEIIVPHRYKFSRVGEVDYNNHNPKTLNPIPIHSVIEEWKTDYAKMSEDMIYEEDKPSFEDLISNLEDIREKLQKLSWTYEVSFPNPKS